MRRLTALSILLLVLSARQAARAQDVVKWSPGGSNPSGYVMSAHGSVMGNAGPTLSLRSTTSDSIKANYRKTETRITMRDGVRLFTAIYVPRDTTREYPILISRTPYGIDPYGESNYRDVLGPSNNPNYAASGFIFVYQDVRGRYYSEGTYTEMKPHKDAKVKSDVDESTDAYDTIDWLIKNVPHNNGRVAIFGNSYQGFYATASCIDAHPALKMCEPGSAMTNLWWGDDLFHNGAFMLGGNFDFYLDFGRGPRSPKLGPDPRYSKPDSITDAYAFFLKMGSVGPGSRKWLPRSTAPLWDSVMRHPSYDKYWQARDISKHTRRMPAMLIVGGFYDAEDLAGPWRTFRGVELLSPGSEVHLVVGPWAHLGWTRGEGNSLGMLRWNERTAPWFRDSVEFPFYLHFLKGAADPRVPKVLVFRTGGDRWDRLDAWPPSSSRPTSLYLTAKETLSRTRPSNTDGSAPGLGFDEYVSDPAHPVPTVDHPDPDGEPREYMTADQRFAAARRDVVVFQTEPLTADITISGPVTPRLYISTSGTDADFDVKLIDVFPSNAPNWPGDISGFMVAGYQQLVRGEPFRGRYRRGASNPSPFVRNQLDSLRFTMPDINHTFRKGHRIMVQIQSSWFPLNDRNPQTFVPNIFESPPSAFTAATMRIFHTARFPSRLEVNEYP